MSTNEKLCTITEITFGEYLKYRLHFASYDKIFLLLMVTVAVLISVVAGRIFGVWVAVAIVILCIVCFAGGLLNELKKIYEADKTITEKRVFCFSPDKIEMKNMNGELVTEFPRDDINEVRETRSNFYIVTFSRKGIIVIKKNCSDELCEFIRNLKK